MDASPNPIWFLGDLGDPWVVAIAAALPDAGPIQRLNCPGELPERPFDRAQPPRVVVLHRHRLSAPDAERLREWRQPDGTRAVPALILCVSPYVRYEELERWGRLVDLVVSEATAQDVLPRHVGCLIEGPDRRGPALEAPAIRIEVAAGDLELGQTLVEACQSAGYRAVTIDDQEIGETPRSRNPSASPLQRALTIWEVPVLEPGWAQRLERQSLRTGPVLALAGFADRAIVTRAKASGAVACLDLPCNRDDLLDVIDRTVRSTRPEAWPLPVRVEPPQTMPPPPRRRATPRRAGMAVVRVGETA